MKTTASTVIALLITSSLAIAQSGTDKKEAEKKAATERQRSMGGYKTENEMKDEKGEITPVSPTSDGNENRTETRQQEKNAPGSVVSPNEIQTTSSGDSSSRASNTPSVIQPTTSESGSPSILSENNGRGRDGTGNVQRAKPNIAGAQVPEEMNLGKENSKQTDNSNGSSRIREEEEMPARITSGQNSGQVKADDGEKVSGTQAENKNKDAKKKDKRKKAKRKDKDS